MSGAFFSCSRVFPYLLYGSSIIGNMSGRHPFHEDSALTPIIGLFGGFGDRRRARAATETMTIMCGTAQCVIGNNIKMECRLGLGREA